MTETFELPKWEKELWTEEFPNPCLHVRRYASRRISNAICLLPAGHLPAEKHSNGRLRWTERVLVVTNRRDRRS